MSHLAWTSSLRNRLIVLFAVSCFGLSACAHSNRVSEGGTISGGAGNVQPAALTADTAAMSMHLRMVAELPPPAARNGAEQPISANDVLMIDIFQVDSLDRTVQVDAAGNISLPLIGNIKAAGKTVRELEQEIEAAYGRDYLQSPDVTIFVKESVGQRITIDGEVARPGLHPVSSTATLLDAIALAGGFREVADPSRVYVYRNYGDQKLVANYDVDQIRKGARANPRIYGGDVIIVFTSGGKVAMQNLMQALGVATSASRLAVLPL